MNNYKKMKFANGKTMDEHRYVMKVKGFNTVVHHIDGNKANNNPENLAIMSRSEHCKLHGFGTEIRPTKIFAPDIDGTAVCRICGERKQIEMFKKDSNWSHGRDSICKECFNAYKRNRRKLAHN